MEARCSWCVTAFTANCIFSLPHTSASSLHPRLVTNRQFAMSQPSAAPSAGMVGDVVSALSGPMGLGSSEASDVAAAQLCMGSLMALCPTAAFEHIHTSLHKLLDP